MNTDWDRPTGVGEVVTRGPRTPIAHLGAVGTTAGHEVAIDCARPGWGRRGLRICVVLPHWFAGHPSRRPNRGSCFGDADRCRRASLTRTSHGALAIQRATEPWQAVGQTFGPPQPRSKAFRTGVVTRALAGLPARAVARDTTGSSLITHGQESGRASPRAANPHHWGRGCFCRRGGHRRRLRTPGTRPTARPCHGRAITGNIDVVAL